MVHFSLGPYAQHHLCHKMLGILYTQKAVFLTSSYVVLCFLMVPFGRLSVVCVVVMANPCLFVSEWSLSLHIDFIIQYRCQGSFVFWNVSYTYHGVLYPDSCMILMSLCQSTVSL